jgi:hypothetical protein
VIAAAVPLLLTACERRDGPTVVRPHDAVVLTGAQVPGLQGIPPSRLVAFRFKYGTWEQIPVQVDERAVVDLAVVKHQAPIGKTALLYTDANTWTGADPNANVDADDEIAFMVKDLFGQAHDIDDNVLGEHYTLDHPPNTVAGSGVEVEVSDPLGTDRTSWLYLFRSDGTLDPSAGRAPIDYEFVLESGNYKTTYDIAVGPNPEDSSVTTGSYSMSFPDRWQVNVLSLSTPGASGTDILDGHKSGFAGTCARSEGTFAAGAGAMIANKTGPVRAIRSYLGANSGTFTQRDHLMYETRVDVTTYLRVHAIPPLRDWMDYSPAATGMTFSADTQTAGVTVDGAPDAFPPAFAAWELIAGGQGSVAHTGALSTNIAGLAASLVHYYSDDTTPAEQQCTGDAFQYGASGTGVNMNVPCTDPVLNCTEYLTTARRMTMLKANASTATAALLAQQHATPLAVTFTPFTP